MSTRAAIVTRVRGFVSVIPVRFEADAFGPHHQNFWPHARERTSRPFPASIPPAPGPPIEASSKGYALRLPPITRERETTWWDAVNDNCDMMPARPSFFFWRVFVRDGAWVWVDKRWGQRGVLYKGLNRAQA